MNSMYSDDPTLTWHSNTEMWELNKPFTVTWQGREWVIPAGFKTDLASIPRTLQGIVTKVGKHIQPAIAHDWFYENADKPEFKITKVEADQMFLDGMKHVGVRWSKRYLMYWAVRANFNGGVWG